MIITDDDISFSTGFEHAISCARKLFGKMRAEEFCLFWHGEFMVQYIYEIIPEVRRSMVFLSSLFLRLKENFRLSTA